MADLRKSSMTAYSDPLEIAARFQVDKVVARKACYGSWVVGSAISRCQSRESGGNGRTMNVSISRRQGHTLRVRRTAQCGLSVETRRPFKVEGGEKLSGPKLR